MNFTLCSLVVCLAFVAAVARAQSPSQPAIPKPYVIAPACTDTQRESAVAVTRTSEAVAACFYLEKWSFKGAALAFTPEDYANRLLSQEDFRLIRRRVYAEQSARLRSQRDMREALPGEPPSHASTPLSLFVRTRTPIGVFLNEANHIGYADLVPLTAHNDMPARGDHYPLLQLETLVLVKGRLYKLIQLSPISGPSTIGEGFRMADDWARRFNGGERLATED